MAYEWLRLGVRAALDGNREDARYYFVQAVRTDLNFGRAWLYLGGLADDPALTLSCMQKVLQLEPDEVQAWTGLAWAREKLGLQQLFLPGLPEAPPPPPPWTEPPPAEVLTLPVMPVPAPPPAEEVSGEAILNTISVRFMRRGAAAAAGGDRPRARYYFLKAIAADSNNARAWLYLGGVAGDAFMTLACMERVLRTEPANLQARAGANWAKGKLGLVIGDLFD